MRWLVVLASKIIRNAPSAYRLIGFERGGGEKLEGGVIFLCVTGGEQKYSVQTLA
jgi:hypothetical protein